MPVLQEGLDRIPGASVRLHHQYPLFLQTQFDQLGANGIVALDMQRSQQDLPLRASTSQYSAEQTCSSQTLGQGELAFRSRLGKYDNHLN
ncbi:MAG: hypothetical protein Q7S69_03820 [Nitrosomonadaceae bacterium]|nr:hypothetical protein [Nitrosomonadaceae bacterium]